MASETINMCLQNPKNSKCRACLSEENLLSLFSHGLSVKIMKLADIKIYEGDGLPSTICIDCEVEVKRCYNFVAQIKRADAKLREMLENNEDSSEISENEEDLKENGKSEEASASQIDIEELNIKQEALDSFIDEKQEKMSDTDHAHYDDVPDTIGDENKLNPLNQVDIVVDPLGGEGMDVAIDPLGQEEPLIDSNKIYCEPAIDPLTFVKVEGVAMDVDKVDPFVPDAGPSGSSCTTVVIESTITPRGSRKTCAMIGCDKSKARFPGLHFFKFPTSRPDICKQWMTNCGNKGLQSLSKSALRAKVLCENHFTNDRFMSIFKTRLKVNAVPTLLQSPCSTVTLPTEITEIQDPPALLSTDKSTKVMKIGSKY